MKRIFLPLLMAASLLAACASFTDRTQELQVGMSPDQVKNVLGDDYQVRANRAGTDGRMTTAWEYKDPDHREGYWVYFRNGQLVQWGAPSALQTMPPPDGRTVPAAQ